MHRKKGIILKILWYCNLINICKRNNDVRLHTIERHNKDSHKGCIFCAFEGKVCLPTEEMRDNFAQGNVACS